MGRPPCQTVPIRIFGYFVQTVHACKSAQLAAQAKPIPTRSLRVSPAVVLGSAQVWASTRFT
jgi:hypothetical protein